MQRVRTNEALEALWQLPLAALLKHSDRCLRSWYAYEEVMQFMREWPDAPVYFILIQDERDLCDCVTERTGIPHASPQMLVLRQGTVVAKASHDGITAEWLRRTLRER